MRILKMNQKNFKEVTEIVMELIKEGKVIIFPTDTVYIPIADATNKKAVRKVFQIKQRSQKTPFPIFVKDIKMAKKLARIDKTQEKFLKIVWPGKITAVLKRPRTRTPAPERSQVQYCAWRSSVRDTANSMQGKKKTKTRIYGVAKDTIALRIPDFKPVNFLLEKLKIPLVGTSANISGKPASGNLKKILSQFRNKKYQPDLMIDAGNLPNSKSSTVLDLTILPPKILRP